jgi:hypothetical protein
VKKRRAKRVVALAEARRDALVAEARDLVALLKRKRDAIADEFYDMGLALRRLKKKEMLASLGKRSFAELCDTELGISAAFADKLVDVVTRMSREDAIAMGQSKAIAMVALADATPAADTPRELFEKGLVVRGRALDPKKASVRAIEEAAKRIRATRPQTRRGRTTTAEERAFAERVEKAMHALGLSRASVSAVATKPGRGADLRIEHAPIADAAAVAKALSRALHRRG